MRFPFVTSIVVVLSTSILSTAATADEAANAKPSPDRKAMAESIRKASAASDVAALAEVRQSLSSTRSGERLDAALAEKEVSLRTTALLALADDLAFEPTVEAPTPEGWPAFTPIQEIELKSYPAYRTAFTKGSTLVPDSVMFWKLFLHIQRNKISMTAPVEMTLDDGKKQNTTAMAFMYQSDEIGKLGDDVNVTVVDVPAQLAISVGLRGEMDRNQIADATKRIDQWLADHASEYTAAGDLRVLGYNSPSLDTDKKYYEVQRVVAKKEPAK